MGFYFPHVQVRVETSETMDRIGIVSTIEELDAVAKYLKTKLKVSDFITKSDRWGFIVQYRDSDSKILAAAVCSLAYTFYQGPVASIETIKSNGNDALVTIMDYLDTYFYRKLELLKVRYFKGIGPRLKLLDTEECTDFERESFDRKMGILEDKLGYEISQNWNILELRTQDTLRMSNKRFQNSSFEIRQAVKEDIPEIIALNQTLACDLFKVPQNRFLMYPELLEKYAFSKSTRQHTSTLEFNEILINMFVAVCNKTGKVVGNACVIPQMAESEKYGWKDAHVENRYSRLAYLEMLIVDSKYRRNGLASGLISKVCEWAVRKGCKKVRWDTHGYMEETLKFYYSLGARNLTTNGECMMLGKDYPAVNDVAIWRRLMVDNDGQEYETGAKQIVRSK